MKTPLASVLLLPIAGSLLLAGATARAQDAPPNLDADLPQPLGDNHFEALLGNSPFLRVLDLTETYALRGIAEIDGEKVATLFNKQTEKSVLVSAATPNAEQMRLVGVNEATDFLAGISATIAVAGEEVELKFEPERVAPKPKGRPSGGPGNASGGDRRDGDSQRRGPSKEDMERYKSLPDEKKEKFREYIRQSMQKYPDMSREERGNLIRGALTRLAEGGDISIDANNSGGGSGGGGDNRGGGDGRSSDRGGDRGRR